MRPAIIIVLLAIAAQAETLPEPGRFAVDLKPQIVLTSLQVCPTGYCWNYSNGASIRETFAERYVRTGRRPPETRAQCSTGYCGKFSSYPTVATGSCACGCNGDLCNCEHSKNAGKPLSQQTYQPGRVARSNQPRR